MAALVAGLAVTLHPMRGRAEETPGPGDVRIGLVSSLFRDTPESLIQLMTKPLKSLMESQTGMSGTLAAGGDASHLGKQLQDDRFQLAVFHGVEFAWVRQKHPELKPLVVAIRDGRPMHAILMVRDDSGIASVADLTGKSLAVCRQCREHCRLFIERRCEACGKPYNQLCSKVTTPCDSEDALDDVVDGVVQAAVVDGAALERYKKDKPDRFAKLKAAQRSEPFPPAVIAYKPGVLSEKILERFRDGLINAHKNTKGKQLLNMCRITCFEAVPDDYEQMLVAIAKAYPPPETRTEK
jgi:ABC-type phosphate/phosphonate transport system substrate-binding protein